MTQRENDNLNRLLRHWLDRTLPPDDARTQSERILRTLAELPQPGGPLEGRRSCRKRRLLAWLAAGAAAVLLALLAGWMLRAGREAVQPPSQRREQAKQPEARGPIRDGRQPDVEPPRRAGAPAGMLLAQLDNEELQRRLEIFDSLDELFEKKWAWMVECGDRVDLNVRAGPFNPGSAPVAARLAVLAREARDQEFRVEEKAFVLTHEQQLVEALLKDGATREICFWAYKIDDGLYAYDVDLVVEKPQSLSISTSGVVVPGRPARILSLRHGECEYGVVLLLMSRPNTAPSTSKRRL